MIASKLLNNQFKSNTSFKFKLDIHVLNILIQFNHFLEIQSEPIEGVAFEIVDENLFEWRAYVEGPPETDYEGGVFQIQMKFPNDYPMSPPTLTFLSEFWHPNVYMDGKVCISILHPPGEDETSGELPEERWLPTQTVSTIILSVISLLSAPNTSSPANVDASVEWRNDREAYKKRIKTLITKANQKVPSHIKIPHPDSDPQERAKQVEKMHLLNKPMDFFDDDYDDYNNDDDDEDNEDYYDDDDEEDDEGVDEDDD
ncbi:ubiquitin-conjugating enzyme E2 [Tieghemostelium lacteum]|uniref:Ubiquitin-conjugating enzyme E2 n=1 Tax=Tieghemostelium lacteum TaxID=361077 RepID=A0A151Z449_TIELA|nr:ubiquitin-conjugating enzyme E2 [Tieghemostelium lacteum]|eukprot:KYQ88739.1 ubiquitin-conjugating enzyme E2 [Tieghemostelium lacteum]